MSSAFSSPVILRAMSATFMLLAVVALLVVIDLTKTRVFGLSVGFEGMLVWSSVAWLAGVILAVLAFVSALISFRRSKPLHTRTPMLLMNLSAGLLLIVVLFGLP